MHVSYIYGKTSHGLKYLKDSLMTVSESLKATIDKWHFGNNVTFMELYIFKGKDFHINSKLGIKVYQNLKKKFCMFLLEALILDILLKIIDWVKRYVRINTDELKLLKIRNNFFLRMRNRGFNKHKLSL